MNKKEFLKELTKRLKLLSEEEKRDICNEYEDIIDEKVKHGKTEEEAVKEFGDIASLSEEILKSYKINPKYQNTTSDFLGDCEELIKKGAKKLSDVTEQIAESFKKSGAETTLENIFEIIIKVLILLVAIAVIHIPFWFIGEIGSVPLTRFSIFEGMNPLQNVIAILWKILAEVAYVIVCVLLAIAIFKKYFNNTKEENTKQVKKEKVISEKKTSEKKTKVIEKESVTPKKNTSQDTLGRLLVILLKIWIAILFIMPLVFIQIALLTCICVIIYLLVKGVEIYGLTILMVGVSLFIGHLIKILIDGLFTKRKIYFWPLSISFIMVVIGIIFTVDYFFSFTYHDDIKDSNYQLNTIKYELEIKDSLDTYYDEVIIDESLEDNEVRYEVSYYSDFVEIEKSEYTQTICEDTCTIRTNYYIHTSLKDSYSVNDILNETIIKNLKDKKIYNYSELLDPTIRIYVNSKTKNKLD